jgi:hypothetical protein
MRATGRAIPPKIAATTAVGSETSQRGEEVRTVNVCSFKLDEVQEVTLALQDCFPKCARQSRGIAIGSFGNRICLLEGEMPKQSG